MKHIGLTLSKAASYVGRHPKTLQGWDRAGKLPAKRTNTGRRYWLKKDLDEYLGLSGEETKRIVAYCRVSSQAQKPDLKNQREIMEEFCVSNGKANVEYITEIGGGLNFKRIKFLNLVDDICNEKISEVIVAHKDRFCRFGFELLEHLAKTHGCTITVINVEKLSPEQEMVQDLMTIIHCFSSRLYGLRNYRKALKEALKNDSKP
jgi:predicted site-specific integrase-resolvase